MCEFFWEEHVSGAPPFTTGLWFANSNSILQSEFWKQSPSPWQTQDWPIEWVWLSCIGLRQIYDQVAHLSCTSQELATAYLIFQHGQHLALSATFFFSEFTFNFMFNSDHCNTCLNTCFCSVSSPFSFIHGPPSPNRERRQNMLLEKLADTLKLVTVAAIDETGFPASNDAPDFLFFVEDCNCWLSTTCIKKKNKTCQLRRCVHRLCTYYT